MAGRREVVFCSCSHSTAQRYSGARLLPSCGATIYHPAGRVVQQGRRAKGPVWHVSVSGLAAVCITSTGVPLARVRHVPTPGQPVRKAGSVPPRTQKKLSWVRCGRRIVCGLRGSEKSGCCLAAGMPRDPYCTCAAKCSWNSWRFQEDVSSVYGWYGVCVFKWQLLLLFNYNRR